MTEAERTPEGARDRFRRITQRALNRFQEAISKDIEVLSDGIVQTLADDVRRECEEAAREYRKNLAKSTL
jgi:hypothetical protein